MGRRLVGLATIAVFIFLYLPIATIFLYSFNADRSQTWPITEWTTHWYADAIANQQIRDALFLTLEAAAGATLIALVLGPWQPSPSTGSASSAATRCHSCCSCRSRSPAS
ncbi:MAG: hypothetical protein U0838_07155 [Chloroflexota bacterium]